MITQKVQSEKATLMYPKNTEQKKSHQTDSKVQNDKLAMLLLRLQLSGTIADADREYIDNLAPEKSLAFIFKGKDYIHPQDVPLFDYELIETAVEQGGEAIFSHRFQPSSASSHGQLYKIFTVIINPDEDEEDKIIFGFFGPEHLLSFPENENRFITLASSLRKFHKKVMEQIPRIMRSLEHNTPVLLINRCSHEVVTVNDHALRVLEADLPVIMGTDYEKAGEKLSDLITSGKTRIENLNIDELELSLLYIHADNIKSEKKSIADNILRELLLNHTQKMIEAKEGLERTKKRLIGFEESDYLKVIVDETEKINQLIQQAIEAQEQ